MSRRLIVAIAALGLAAAGTAHADPIQTRQKLMDANGAAAKVSGEMIKGNIPFNQDVANSVLATFHAVGLSYRDYFPEGSDVGDTHAKENIWTDREGFIAADDKLAEAAAAAIAAKPADLDSFKQVFGPIGESCKNCHETYRLPYD